MAADATPRLDALSRTVPGLAMLRSYRPALFGKDLVAGLVLTTLLVPQGMAYAELAGLPAITGLYTTILALLAYALFGPSRVLVLGPDSSLGPMIAAIVVPFVAADGDAGTAVAYASVLALMVGAITVLAGVFNLGFIADLLSKPTQIGYMNGLALTILVSQLPKLFGFSVDADGLIGEAVAFAEAVSDGETVEPRWRSSSMPGPDRGTSAPVADLPGRAHRRRPRDRCRRRVRSRGPRCRPGRSAPVRLPTPHVADGADRRPGTSVRRRARHLTGLTHRHHLERVRVRRQDRGEIDGNREMIGVGAASIAAGASRGSPSAPADRGPRSRSRAARKPRSPAWSELAAFVALLIAAPGLLRNLPQPALAAVVIAASLSLADIAGLRRLRRQRRSDFVLALVAFLSVALLGVLYGIAAAVGLSILNVFRRLWWPHQAILGRSGGVRGYHDRLP